MNIELYLDNELTMRMGKRVDLRGLYEVLDTDYVIAGGSLRAETPNDFDVYAASSDHPFYMDALASELKTDNWEYVTRTANALTMKDPDGRIFQFCTYAKKTPQALVASFDFAHCQVGLVVRESKDGRGIEPEAVYTPDFAKAMALQTTWFTGSEYPVASLCRLTKYAKRGLLSGRAATHAVVDILTAILERGFRDYDDFKNQMDAVDLNYADENVYALWEAVRKVPARWEVK